MMHLVNLAPLLCAAIILSPTASAQTDTRVYEHLLDMKKLASEEGRPAPLVREYVYGLKLDMAKVLSMTPSMKSCGLIPMAMTYEDASGRLITVLYETLGDCLSY